MAQPAGEAAIRLVVGTVRVVERPDHTGFRVDCEWPLCGDGLCVHEEYEAAAGWATEHWREHMWRPDD